MKVRFKYRLSFRVTEVDGRKVDFGHMWIHAPCDTIKEVKRKVSLFKRTFSGFVYDIDLLDNNGILIRHLSGDGKGR